MVQRKVIIEKLKEIVDNKITIIADSNPLMFIFRPFIDKAANKYICKADKSIVLEANDIETFKQSLVK